MKSSSVTIYTHPDKASRTARFIKFALKYYSPGSIGQEKDEQKMLESDREATPLTRKLRKNYAVEVQEIDGRKVWTVAPKNQASDTVILYLHGGAYVNNLLIFHWWLIERIIRRTNATVLVADYPLAPKYKAETVFSFMDSFYAYAHERYPDKKLVFMGDSAGGGLALAYTQELQKSGKKLPSQLILHAPWLDVTMENPEITAILPHDRMLHPEPLVEFARFYAGDWDLKDQRVSPLFGNFDALPPISIFIGTHDILYPDTQKLVAMMEANSLPMNMYIYPEMFHVWMGIPWLKESKMVLKQIGELLQE